MYHRHFGGVKQKNLLQGKTNGIKRKKMIQYFGNRIW